MERRQEKSDMQSSQTGQTTSRSAETLSARSTAKQAAEVNAAMRKVSSQVVELLELDFLWKTTTSKQVLRACSSAVAALLHLRAMLSSEDKPHNQAPEVDAGRSELRRHSVHG